MTTVSLFRLVWGLWALSWMAATPWSGRTIKRVVTGATTLCRIIILSGAVLLFDVFSAWIGGEYLWQVSPWSACLLAALTLPGFLFAWWARLHLGRLWSGAITRKEGHRLVDTGPYALVRHPIYTGLIGATLVTSVAEATPAALLGAVLIALGLCSKAALEEQFLRRELGSALYDAYRQRVPMLVPRLATSRGRAESGSDVP
jgi:protein-S-isoprenylcysteine O-methyltransferase Ste14